MLSARLLPLVIISLLITSLFVSCQTAFATSDDWSMYQHDAAHTGVATNSGDIYPVSIWNSSVCSKGIAVSDGLAYYLWIMKSVLVLRCVNVSTGAVVWDNTNVSDNDANNITPAVVDGVVYLNTAAYNATNGLLLIDYSYYDANTSPTVADGLIFLGRTTSSGVGFAFAIHTKIGVLLWNLTRIINSSNSDLTQFPVAVQNGVAYFASGKGVFAVNATTGVLQWQYSLPNYLPDSTGAISVSNKYVIVSIGSDLYCLNAADGQKVWSTQASGVPVVTNKVVIAGGTAYNVSSGVKVWSLNIGNLSTPVVSGNAVYYGRYVNVYGDYYKHELLGVNVATGEIFWTYKLEQINQSQKAGLLAVTNQNLFVCDTGRFELFPTVSYPNVLAFNLTFMPQTTAIVASDDNLLIVGLIISASIIAVIVVVGVYVFKRKN